MNSFEEVKADFHSRFDADMTRRVQKIGLLLVQELRTAIKLKTKVSSGSQGSLGAIQSDTKLEPNQVRLQIGIAANGDYLKYRLFGVMPAPGAIFAGFSKIPPPKKMAKWAKKSGITVPTWAKQQAEANAKRSLSPRKHPKFDAKKDAPWNSSDPYEVWGFRISQNLKTFGIKPLQHPTGGKLIETVLTLQKTRITSILQGAEG